MGLIDAIYDLGDDALDNQIEIIFSANPLINAIREELKFRVISFEIPEMTIGTYEVAYKTQKFNKPNGRIDTDNEFSFTFRVDKYWDVYETLLAWKTQIGNEFTGIMGTDVNVVGTSSIRTDVLIKTLDSAGRATGQIWHIEKAFISSIGSISFDQTSDGEPIELDVTLQCLKFYAEQQQV